MEAIILAGGLGTRLRGVVGEMPKPMAPINKIPFLEYIFKYLKKNGINKVILSVGYKWESIKEYFGDEFENIDIIYSVESEPLGTGGAIKKAMKLVSKRDVFIVNGDTFFDVNLNELKLKGNSKLLLSLKKMRNFDRYGCVEIDGNGFVLEFTEKGFRKSGSINCGIYLASKNLFDGYTLQDKFSFEEFMQNEFESLNIISKTFNGYFIDIGIPEDYEIAQIELRNYI